MRVLLAVGRTYHWCLVLASIPLLVSACGSKGLQKPPPTTARHITVSLPWRAGGTIPRRYTCDGAGLAPRVVAQRVPGEADQAIVMTDPDAPGGTFVHWTKWGRGEGRNSFGKTGYGPPCPPRGDKPHHYVLTVYALRRRLALAPGAAPNAVLAAIRPAALASGSTTGLYGR
jgi:phosphatidylethanolamine-binding protein (PEBP) family uncharacterized protein